MEKQKEEENIIMNKNPEEKEEIGLHDKQEVIDDQFISIAENVGTQQQIVQQQITQQQNDQQLNDQSISNNQEQEYQHFDFTFEKAVDLGMTPLPPVNITPRIFTRPMIEQLKIDTPDGNSYDVQRRTSFWGGGDVGPNNMRPPKRHLKPVFKPTIPKRRKKNTKSKNK